MIPAVQAIAGVPDDSAPIALPGVTNFSQATNFYQTANTSSGGGSGTYIAVLFTILNQAVGNTIKFLWSKGAANAGWYFLTNNQNTLLRGAYYNAGGTLINALPFTLTAGMINRVCMGVCVHTGAGNTLVSYANRALVAGTAPGCSGNANGALPMRAGGRANLNAFGTEVRLHGCSVGYGDVPTQAEVEGLFDDVKAANAMVPMAGPTFLTEHVYNFDSNGATIPDIGAGGGDGQQDLTITGAVTLGDTTPQDWLW